MCTARNQRRGKKLRRLQRRRRLAPEWYTKEQMQWKLTELRRCTPTFILPLQQLRRLCFYGNPVTSKTDSPYNIIGSESGPMSLSTFIFSLYVLRPDWAQMWRGFVSSWKVTPHPKHSHFMLPDRLSFSDSIRKQYYHLEFYSAWLGCTVQVGGITWLIYFFF